MERRTYLTMVGSTVTALSVGVAGCGEGPDTETEADGDDGDDGEDGLGDGDSPTDTPEETGDSPLGNETTTEGGMGTDTPGTETADGETTAPGTDGTGTDGGTATVEMVTDGSDYYFDPIGLAVEPGTTVTWTNESGSHSSTAYAESLDAADVTRIPADAEPWNSETISEEGATFEHTPEVEGTYDYFCIPHKTLDMIGRLVVGEPGGPATEGSPPDGELPASTDIVEQGSISYDEFSG